MMRSLRWKNIGYLSVCLLLLWLTLVGHADEITNQIDYRLGLYPDFATNLRVEYIGHRIALAAGLTNNTFKVYNDKALNAMALPDGRVYITSKMATLVTDDELAFVIGHELTHVKEKHAQRQSERATGGAILGAILGGVLGGSASDIRMGANILGGLTASHYSQQDEYKADAGGVRLMTQAGYDPKRAADAMQRLIDLYGRGDAKTPVLGWFASHPDTKNRQDRLRTTATELEQHPLPKIPEPIGIELTLDRSAEHARAWAHTYLAILLADSGAGRAEVLSSPDYPIHRMITPPAEPPRDERKNDKDKNEDSKPLPAVTVFIPDLPVAYRVTLALHEVPAGRAATIADGRGTAVEARLHWTQLSSGFSGDCIASAQRRERTPWIAQEQLQDPDKLYELATGKEDNVEGTLEAKAIRRASMAFAEILEANGPVDHSAPVTITLSNTEKIRPGDYVEVVRGNLVVAEVCVEQVNGKREVSGVVLWGTHNWMKKDRFIHETE
ncbi:MAG TPA: M48 family metallopeptidase [Armatimonadota bacterium]